MVKLVGYVEMKKKVGKVLFVEQDGSEECIGKSTDKIFLFDDLSQKLSQNQLVMSWLLVITVVTMARLMLLILL